MYVAMSNACWSVRVPGRSNGMLYRMNDAARSCRAIDAPMLNDFGPQRAGIGLMPAPLFPWQRAQFPMKSGRPRDESPVRPGGILAIPSNRRCSPFGTPREMYDRYAT